MNQVQGFHDRGNGNRGTTALNKLRRSVSFWIILCVGLSYATVAAASEDTQFSQSVELYQSARYREAALVLEALADQGFSSTEVYYNLGNSYYKARAKGKAIWAYERALLLDPRDEDIRWNLNLAQRQLEDREDIEEKFWVLALIKGVLSYVRTDEMAWAFAVCMGGLSLGIIGYALILPWRSFFAKINSILLVLILLSTGLVYLRWTDVRYPSGIVQEREVYVRYGPAAGNTKAFLLHEGSKVLIEKEAGSWYFVRFGKRQSGWLPKHTLLKIEP